MSRYPLLRLRRLRESAFARALAQEATLSPANLIWPLFAHDEPKSAPVAALPGVSRLCFDDLWRAGERALQLQIPMVAVFPVVAAALKDSRGGEAQNPNGIVARATRGLKERFPELGVMTDVALDPFTSHGHDGVVNAAGEVDNDETVELLRQQALMQAAAGADVVAPSDMMDGRVGVLRRALEEAGLKRVIILAYSAKYASAFYGPFRSAIGSAAALGKAGKRGYQLNPANRREALREIALDIEEGADMVMVKPGMPYLDIVRDAAERFDLPVAAYQVSGEYAMLKAAAANGWLDEAACAYESLLAFRRAGACAVVTYFAEAVAAALQNKG
jgi:porphobilinogen synthase